MAPPEELTYRFVLSDREFGRAWLREFYRRPGWRLWRVVGGPCFLLLGLGMARAADAFTAGAGLVSIAFGAWYLVRPWIAMRAMVARRRRSGRSEVELEVRLHRRGIRIDDGRSRTELPWERIVASGRGPDYVWYELEGGSRATIPLRVVEDPEALRRLLGAHTAWHG